MTTENKFWKIIRYANYLWLPNIFIAGYSFKENPTYSIIVALLGIFFIQVVLIQRKDIEKGE